MKFVLDGTIWMEGSNLHLPATHDHHFTEGAVVFPNPSTRYLHGFDNLHTDDSLLCQQALGRRFDPAPLYDVIIVGSGMGGGILADALSTRSARSCRSLVCRSTITCTLATRGRCTMRAARYGCPTRVAAWWTAPAFRGLRQPVRV